MISDVFSLSENVSFSMSQISLAVSNDRKFSPMSMVIELTSQDMNILFSAIHFFWVGAVVSGAAEASVM